MNLEEYLLAEKTTRAELSRKLGISKAAISKWEEIPEKWLEVLSAKVPVRDVSEEEVEPLVSVSSRRVMVRNWKIKGDKIYWMKRWWGRGSEYDFTQSAQNISEVRKLIKETGVDGALQQLGKYGAVDKSTGEWIPTWPSDFIRDIKNNKVCPVIVDEIESRFEGGNTVAFRTDPWKVTTEVGEGFKVEEYFLRRSSS